MQNQFVVGQGTVVTVAYTAQLKDGDSVELPGQPSPVEFAWGAKELPSHLQTALVGMAPEEERTVTLTPAEAFGERLPERRLKIKRAKFSERANLFIGRRLLLKDTDGGRQPYFITHITPEHVLVGRNHPFSGQEITFNVKVLEVKATDQEQATTTPTTA